MGFWCLGLRIWAWGAGGVVQDGEVFCGALSRIAYGSKQLGKMGQVYV